MIIILWLIDIIIISKGFWYKDILDSHKGKTRSVIRRGLMRYRLLVQTVLLIPVHVACLVHMSHDRGYRFSLGGERETLTPTCPENEGWLWSRKAGRKTWCWGTNVSHSGVLPCCFGDERMVAKPTQNPGRYSWYQSQVKNYLALWRDSVEIGLVIP